jgi:hypothetical protein
MAQSIEQLKTAAESGIAFGKEFAKAVEDGKLSFREAFALIPEGKDLFDALKEYKLIFEEIKDMDDEEAEAFLEAIKAEIDNMDADIVIDWMILTLRTINHFRKK